jgi:hypothetical protein
MRTNGRSRRRLATVDPRSSVARRLGVGVLVVLGIVSIVVAAWSVDRGGIGWDSRSDARAAAAVRSVDSSWPLARAYQAVPAANEFYGVFLYQFADLLRRTDPGSARSLDADQSSTYVYLGAATLVLSVLSLTALAVAIAVAFRSVLAGVFAWSLTLATPLWLGMSHVDFKDSPVASGMTLVTAGLVLSLVLRPRLRATVVCVLIAGSGGAVMLATRPASVVLLLGLVGGTLGAVLLSRIVLRRQIPVRPAAATSGSTLLAALAFTWATNPIARISMLQWLRDSINLASAYPWNGIMRVAGHDVYSRNLPWWYVPAWLCAQLPLLTLAAVLGGTVFVIVHVARRGSLIGTAATIPIVPIALQAIVVPVGIVGSGAVLYDGIRHLLFLVPALIAIPAVGLALLDSGARPRARRLLPLGAVVIVAASLFASIRWAPYSYAFINPVAGRTTWDLDYWGVSAHEGVSRLHDLGLSSAYVEPFADVGIPYGAIDSPVGPFGTFLNPIVPSDHTGVYVFLRSADAADYGCIVVFTIKRDGHVLGEGARCPAAAPG